MSALNLKRWLKKFCFTRDLGPFVWIGNIFGIFQCRLVNNRLKVAHKINRCYVLLLFGVRLYFRISSISYIVFPQSLLITIVMALANGTRIIVEIADFIVTAFFDRRFIEFFDKIAVYDEKAAKLGHPRCDRVSTYWIFFVLSIGFALWVIVGYSQHATDETWMNVVLNDVKFVIRELIYLLGILKFNLLVHLLYQRFRHLNKIILPSVTWSHELTPKMLKFATSSDVIFLHGTLVDASRIINGIYSLMLLCWFTNLLFTALVYTYIVTSKTTWYAGTALSTALFVEILVTCSVCNLAAEEANNTGRYMSKDKATLIEDSIAMDRLQMQFYLFNNRVAFSAGDFFEIKLSLVYSMFISIATYGVLLTSYRKKQTATTSTT